MSPWVRLVGSELNTRNGRGPPLLRAIPTIAGIEFGPWAGPGVRVYRLTRRELTIRPALSVTTSINCPARSRTVRTVWPAEFTVCDTAVKPEPTRSSTWPLRRTVPAIPPTVPTVLLATPPTVLTVLSTVEGDGVT